MGKMTVTCPHCKKMFNYDVIDFEYYEKLVAAWLHGKTAQAGTTGYDVYDCEELPNMTIQVKYANMVKSCKSKDYMQWSFYHNISDTQPDFFVLFGLTDYGYEVFVMNYMSFINRSYKRSNKGNEISIMSRCSFDSWIWQYHVPNLPKENLLNRMKSMMDDFQFEFEMNKNAH